MAEVYSIDDQGSSIRLLYFLKTNVPTPLDFRSYEQQGKKVSGNPVSQYRATGASMWATEELARLSLSQRSNPLGAVSLLLILSRTERKCGLSGRGSERGILRSSQLQTFFFPVRVRLLRSEEAVSDDL